MKKKTAVNKKTQQGIWVWRNFLWTILQGLPLAVWNGFFDITEAKTVWFVIWTGAFLIGRAVCLIQYSEPLPRPGRDAAVWAALGLCFVTLLASVSSGFFRESLIGRTGRYQGAAMFWLYALVFLAFLGTELKEREILLPLLAGFALCAFTAVANRLGWDLLGMEGRLRPLDQGRYISTLGNINFAGAYFTLILPTAAWLVLRSEEPSSRLLLGALCVGGLWAAMAVRSESAVLGLGAAFTLMPFTLKNRPRALRRWGLLPAGIALFMQLYRLLAAVVFKAYLSALTRLLLHPAVSAAIAVFGVGWYLLARRREDDRLPALLRAYGVLLAAVLVLGVAGLILLNTVWRELPLGPLEIWLRFSDSWGTDRGLVWKYCLKLYGEFPLPDKIFGGGCGILALLDSTRRIFPDAVLDAAHSEYLQILLNWGALGLICYLTWIVSALRSALRSGRDLPLALSAGLLGYAFNALSNIAQAPGIMLFFVLLAAAHGASASPEGQKSSRS